MLLSHIKDGTPYVRLRVLEYLTEVGRGRSDSQTLTFHKQKAIPVSSLVTSAVLQRDPRRQISKPTTGQGRLTAQHEDA